MKFLPPKFHIKEFKALSFFSEKFNLIETHLTLAIDRFDFTLAPTINSLTVTFTEGLACNPVSIF